MHLLSHVQAVAGLLGLVLLYKLWRARARTHKDKPPPEPSGAWPVIGHLHLLGGQIPIARILGAMADKYGPLFTIQLGMHRTLVVSSWEAAKECFTTNDRAFATRPMSSAGVHMGYNYAAFCFAPYGQYWREIRRLVTLELLSSRRLEKLQHVYISELDTCIKELYLLAKKNEGNGPAKVVISQWYEQLTLNIIARMLSGKRYKFDSINDEEARRFRRVIKDFMCISGQFVLSDAIPFPLLRWIDLQGHLKSMKHIAKELDSIIETWVEEHLQRRPESEIGDEQDFIDVMLSKINNKFLYGHARQAIIKGTIMNLVIAGSDTISINLTWLSALLLNNRHALKLAQDEIDAKVGKNRWAEESDIGNLVYIQAIVKETLRLYPPGPLSVPHEAMEDCQVGGYRIPKGTRLFLNVWKLHRDPRIWSNPENFMPQRFLTSHAELDVYGQQFEFLPFGSGRRSCPGTTFALQITCLAVARLLQGFDFTTPSNESVDMTEGLGISLPKATPLEVLMAPRLPSEFYGQ